jgi:hypothetical protein
MQRNARGFAGGTVRMPEHVFCRTKRRGGKTAQIGLWQAIMTMLAFQGGTATFNAMNFVIRKCG